MKNGSNPCMHSTSSRKVKYRAELTMFCVPARCVLVWSILPRLKNKGLVRFSMIAAWNHGITPPPAYKSEKETEMERPCRRLLYHARDSANALKTHRRSQSTCKERKHKHTHTHTHTRTHTQTTQAHTKVESRSQQATSDWWQVPSRTRKPKQEKKRRK